MRQIRYWTQLLRVFFWKFKGILGLSALAGILLLFFLTKTQELFPQLGRSEAIGIVGRFSTEDLPLSIQYEISRGLTRVDERGNVLPGLAQSWYSEEEGRVWIFKLGESFWQDGKRVVAPDISYKFSDVAYQVEGEGSIKFTLKDPFSPFPAVVSRPVFKRGFLGAGEWKAGKLSLTGGRFIQQIELVSTKSGKMKVYRFYPTEEAARLAFKLGEVNRLNEIIDPRDLRDWKNSKAEALSHKDRYVGVFINTQDPFLSDKSLRQALAYAIDKDNFSEERAISPISPFSWAFNPQVKQYPYNPAKARELIKTLPEDQRTNLAINLVTTPSLLSMADKIKTDWETVGVKTHLQVVNTPPEDFQTLLAIQAIPPDPDQYGFWHSTQAQTNITRFRNTKESQRIDKLLEDGRRTLDKEERKKIYVDFQRFLLEESPVIFLFHPVSYTITRL
ncbi:MAG: hypothetical protein HYS83_02665 [Candidatus Blackburnbacteria bacterium]|nr:hypothetical protein [Candidatus Blackburnbacteria bacterium]